MHACQLSRTRHVVIEFQLKVNNEVKIFKDGVTCIRRLFCYVNVLCREFGFQSEKSRFAKVGEVTD